MIASKYCDPAPPFIRESGSGDRAVPQNTTKIRSDSQPHRAERINR
jgi:hypothetical protein